jgi:hypothetical protein
MHREREPLKIGASFHDLHSSTSSLRMTTRFPFFYQIETASSKSLITDFAPLAVP